MSSNLPHFFRDLGRVLAVIIASLVVGLGLGLGLGKLSGNEAESSTAVDSAPTAPTATTSAPDASGATGTTGSDDAKRQAPRIRVLSSTFEPAATPSGRQRRRARVTVRLRVTARADDATLGTARLIAGDDELRADPKAAKAAGGLLDPIRAGRSAMGELRFETAGALTDRLANRRRATLRVGDRSLPLRLRTP